MKSLSHMIGSFNYCITQISRLWDFTRSYDKTSYRILKSGPGFPCVKIPTTCATLLTRNDRKCKYNSLFHQNNLVHQRLISSQIHPIMLNLFWRVVSITPRWQCSWIIVIGCCQTRSKLKAQHQACFNIKIIFIGIGISIIKIRRILHGNENVILTKFLSLATLEVGILDWPLWG